jgi:hypothetical protein
MRALIPNGPMTLSTINNGVVDELIMKTVALVPELSGSYGYRVFTSLVTLLDGSEVEV